MKITMIIIIAMCMVALVCSIPVGNSEGFRSQVLDRLMKMENENDKSLRNKRTIGILRQLFPTISKDVNPEAQNHQVQDIDVAGSVNNEVRVQFDDNQETNANEALDTELAPLEDIEMSEDENRNKRFLSFGLGGGNSNAGSSSSGGGGSGNFLFDIIRQAADGAARAAGTVYRVVAGTQSLGLGLSASRDLGPPPPASSAAPAPTAASAGTPTATAPATGAGTQPSLVAGSGAPQGDPNNSPGRTDEAVPGPITRLFVIANRGISNLIQDIILRLAATSERIVNFKARLITSII